MCEKQRKHEILDREIRGAICQTLNAHPEAKLKEIQSSLIKRLLGQLSKSDVQKALTS